MLLNCSYRELRYEVYLARVATNGLHLLRGKYNFGRHKILHEIRKRKANWFGHIFRRNCLVKQVIEGKIRGEVYN